MHSDIYIYIYIYIYIRLISQSVVSVMVYTTRESGNLAIPSCCRGYWIIIYVSRGTDGHSILSTFHWYDAIFVD